MRWVLDNFLHIHKDLVDLWLAQGFSKLTQTALVLTGITHAPPSSPVGSMRVLSSWAAGRLRKMEHYQEDKSPDPRKEGCY